MFEFILLFIFFWWLFSRNEKRKEDKKEVIHVVKLESTEGMSDSDIDDYAKKLWGKLTNNGKGWSDNGDPKR